jgi:hypothetical protein
MPENIVQEDGSNPCKEVTIIQNAQNHIPIFTTIDIIMKT